MARPSRASPSTSALADEPTPAMAKTPSAMQAMNTPNPRTPPRSSRSASRSASPNASRNASPGAVGATAIVTPSPRFDRFRHEAAKQEMHRHVQQQRLEDHQAHHPRTARHPMLLLGVAEAVDVIDVHRLEAGIGPRRRHEEEA